MPAISHAIMTDLYFFPFIFFKALFTEHCFIGKRDKNNKYFKIHYRHHCVLCSLFYKHP